jgi:hypothetical protein
MPVKETSMLELTDEQRRELDREGVPRVLDPQTRKTYVLLSEEAYERLRGLLGADLERSEAYPAIDRTFAGGWSDRKMDDYDRYEELTQ